MSLIQNHPFLQTTRETQDICSDILLNKGIQYFNYLRVYDDGETTFFSNHEKLTQYLLDNQIKLAAPVESQYIKKTFNHLILPTGNYSKVVHDVKEFFNIGNSINLVERHKGYIELFCFGGYADNQAIYNLYLNNLDFLENFKNYFKANATAYINDKKLSVKIPECMRPDYKGINNNAFETIKISGRNQSITLSKRQSQCLMLLSKGKTAKEIAILMNLSKRTVENYISHIKDKLNCNYKSELIAILNNYSETLSG